MLGATGRNCTDGQIRLIIRRSEAQILLPPLYVPVVTTRLAHASEWLSSGPHRPPTGTESLVQGAGDQGSMRVPAQSPRSRFLTRPCSLSSIESDHRALMATQFERYWQM